MKEMVERLIADGWKWMAKDKNEKILCLFDEKPKINNVYNWWTYTDGKFLQIPSCLFPEITFEKSPIELKTLLVDEEEEEQDFIRQKLIADKDAYIVREWDNNTKLILVCDYGTGKTALFCKELERYLSTEKIHEKVYLKDLVKKRKVKKSVWVAVDKEEDKIFLLGEKPFRNGDKFVINSNRYTEIEDLDFFYPKKITWEDEPIELTYEVEE